MPCICKYFLRATERLVQKNLLNKKIWAITAVSLYFDWYDQKANHAAVIMLVDLNGLSLGIKVRFGLGFSLSLLIVNGHEWVRLFFRSHSCWCCNKGWSWPIDVLLCCTEYSFSCNRVSCYLKQIKSLLTMMVQMGYAYVSHFYLMFLEDFASIWQSFTVRWKLYLWTDSSILVIEPIRASVSI